MSSRLSLTLLLASFDDNLNHLRLRATILGARRDRWVLPQLARLRQSLSAIDQLTEHLHEQKSFQRVVAGFLDNWSVSGSRPLAASWAVDCGTMRRPIVTDFAGAKIVGLCALGLRRLLGMRPMSPGDLQLLQADGHGTVNVQHHPRMGNKSPNVRLGRGQEQQF